MTERPRNASKTPMRPPSGLPEPPTYEMERMRAVTLPRMTGSST